MKKSTALFLLLLLFVLGVKAQIITTVAGGNTAGYSGDGGQATNAELSQASGVATDAAGNLYIADFSNSCVRKVNTNGIITTVAGNGIVGYTGDGGPATAAENNYVNSVAVDIFGNFYLTNGNNVRKVNTSGFISTCAGNGVTGFSGNGGAATAAELGSAIGIATDASGNLYMADYFDNCIWKVNTSGIISVVAGKGSLGAGFSGDGGPATAAELRSAFDVAVDPAGNLYIADYYNYRVRKVNTSGIISTIAGTGVSGYFGDGGPATAAEFSYITGVSLDAIGNIYVSDFLNYRVRIINTSGIISTFAGNGIGGYSGDGGLATAAELTVYGTASDASGDLYIGSDNTFIRKVSPPCTLTTSASVVANVNCNGNNTGSAIAIPSGGTSPYTYLWSDGNSQTTKTATGLSAGNYTVNVTDANGCSATALVSISQPNQLTMTANATLNVTCSGGNNGGALSVISGGTFPYTYLWSDLNSQTTASASGLTAGNYTVTVSDSCGSSATASVAITQPNILNASTSIVSNATCNGVNNGSAIANPSGGTSPYTYLWSDGNSQTTKTATGLSAGNYTVNVTDANGCSATALVSISQPNQLTMTANATLNVTCSGGNNGGALSVISGGTFPYTYLWSDLNSQTTASASGLTAGNYTVTVSDSCGSSATASVAITQPNILNASTSIVSNATCNGVNNGSAIAIPSGGSSPYTYLWSNFGSQTTQTATGLSAGNYTVNVTDNNGCSATASVNITQPTPLTYTINTDTALNLCNGSCWISLSGGTPPYTYAWGKGGTTDSLANLCGGIYCVFVVDANGCRTATDSVCDSVPVLTSTAINNINNVGKVTIVFPNPSNGLFTIESSAYSGQKSVEIYNTLGEKVPTSNYSLSTNYYSLDLSKQPNGVYFYRVLKNDGSILGEGKLAIEK